MLFLESQISVLLLDMAAANADPKKRHPRKNKTSAPSIAVIRKRRPPDRLSCCHRHWFPVGSPQPRQKVTFVEVSAQFLPADCTAGSGFTAVDSCGNETAYEWISPNQAYEVREAPANGNLEDTRFLRRLRL